MLRQSAMVCVLSALGLAFVAGCNEATPGKSTAKESGSAAADEAPGLKELDAADRKLAEKQKYCPKTGELLGSMGKPYKITLKDRTLFLCCDGCEDEVKKDPDKYLKKLDELLAKK